MHKRVTWVLSGLITIFGILIGIDQLEDGLIRQWLNDRGISVWLAVVAFFLVPVFLYLTLEIVCTICSWLFKSIQAACIRERIYKIEKLTITNDALLAGIHQFRERGMLTIDEELKFLYLIGQLTLEDFLLLEFFDSPTDWLTENKIKLTSTSSGELSKIIEMAIPPLKGKRVFYVASLRKLTLLDLLDLDADNFDTIFLSGSSLPSLSTASGHKIAHIIRTIKQARKSRRSR